MKKLFLFIMLVSLCGVCEAQKVRSVSEQVIRVEKEKVPVTIADHWYVKAGVGAMTGWGTTYVDYNLSFGYSHILNRHGLYCGGQLGVTGMVYDTADFLEDVKAGAGIYAAPTLGIKKRLGTNTIFDGHIAGGYMYAPAKDDDYDDHNRGYWEAGVGIWYKSFLFEIQYMGSTACTLSNGAVFNIGFKF